MDLTSDSLAFAGFIAAQVLAVIVLHRARRQDQSSLLEQRPGSQDTAPSKAAQSANGRRLIRLQERNRSP